MQKLHLTQKELPESERPYEKSEKYGPESLSDAELLAVVIKTGTREYRAIDLAHQILKLSPTNTGLLGLHHLTLNELQGIKGIGRVKSIQLKCLAELTLRMSKEIRRERIRFNDPMSIADYFMEDLRHKNQEQLILLLLDTKNNLKHQVVLTKGTVNASLISTREIFIEALRYEAVNIILLHNHPSGDPTPSREDIQITRQVQKAGELLNIALLDHIIIGDKQYVSLKERGVL